MKKIILLASIVTMISCFNEKKEIDEESAVKVNVEEKFVENQNYAVVWNWTTDDKELVVDNSPVASEELLALWKKGTVENAYYNAKPKMNSLGNFPNISFFLKAESHELAEEILNNLTIVKKGIANYALYPVGMLWLEKKEKVLEEETELLSSFVAVWTTDQNLEPGDELILEQNDAILKLWNESKIENVYFDIEGTQNNNSKTDFVFFINAASIDIARQICEELPFAKNEIASFKLFEVGVHWLGKYEEEM